MTKRNLEDRIIYGCGVCDAGESVGNFKYKLWDEVEMAQAFSAMKEEGMSIREAALQFSVPKSTLGDCISGRVVLGATSSLQTHSDRDEEEEIVMFILRLAVSNLANKF